MPLRIHGSADEPDMRVVLSRHRGLHEAMSLQRLDVVCCERRISERLCFLLLQQLQSPRMQARLGLFIQFTTPTLTKSVRRFLNPTDKGFLSLEGILIFTTTGSIDSTPPPPQA